MRRKFALNTEPHVAEIGDDIVLKFKPEVQGTDFLDAYEDIKEVTDRFNAAQKAGEAEPDSAALRETLTKTRQFVASFLVPESRDDFDQANLPDRLVTELMEFVMELYSGERPTGRSPASARSSPKRGTSGTASSRSKASTRKTGRSRAS